MWSRIRARSRPSSVLVDEPVLERSNGKERRAPKIKIYHIGKATAINNGSHHSRNSSSDSFYLPDDDPPTPVNTVPYIDDYNEEQISAQIERQQSRNWRRSRLRRLIRFGLAK